MIISDIFVEKTQIIFKVQTKFLQPSPDLLPWVPSENICVFTFNRMPSHFCVNQTEVFLISLSTVVLWVPLHMYLEWPGGNADEEGLSVPLETWNLRCTALCPREDGLTSGSCRAWVKVESWAQKRFYQVAPRSSLFIRTAPGFRENEKAWVIKKFTRVTICYFIWREGLCTFIRWKWFLLHLIKRGAAPSGAETSPNPLHLSAVEALPAWI